MSDDEPLHFEVSTGLKRVLGRELITDDEVAIFELVKNSFDAKADTVHLFFDNKRIVIADNGTGMDYEDLNNKWLVVAYSAKRHLNDDFRNVVASRSAVAGSKGIGRFSSDRLGEKVTLQTRPKGSKSTKVHRVIVDWSLFEMDDKERFEVIPVEYDERPNFKVPDPVKRFAASLSHGTIIEIENLRHEWARADLQTLKAALAKLINPFGSGADRFTIYITVPAEKDQDNKLRARAKKSGEELSARDIINGKVGNFIFADLQSKTTYLTVRLEGDKLESSLVDRGELIYKIREPNPYAELSHSGFSCEIYYLNTSAKQTFARRVGLPSVQFGSVFLFRNGFRVFPIGEEADDWFGFNRRKQQGYARHLGSREVIGRVDVFGANDAFQEASSRNQGLIDSPAVRELKECVMDHCLKRLERYVVPVSWPDKAEARTDDISRLLTDPGRARVAAAVAGLVDGDDVELLAYSKKLIRLLNERSDKFETSLVSLRAIAEKVDDKKLLANIDAAEKRFEELRRSEAEARKIADRERSVALKATERAERAEQEVESARSEADIERRRAHFLDEAVNVDVTRILSLHHQITLYSVDINQQIENLLVDTADKKVVAREELVKSLEQISILNRRIHAVSKFAALANFELDSGKVAANLAAFFADYITKIAKITGSARPKIEIEMDDPGLQFRFNPMDVAIIVDNLISNAKRAKASRITFSIQPLEKSGILLRVTDNGTGLAKGVDPKRIFMMGYTTTQGSGLGLYHVQQVLGEMNGSIELDSEHKGTGLSFVIKIAKMGRTQ